jgi:hypothetical protein
LPFKRLSDACTDSFQLIADSLANREPVPRLPDTKKLLRDLESKGHAIRQPVSGNKISHAAALHAMSLTARFEALSDAIHDCRTRANALDWNAWNQNYF